MTAIIQKELASYFHSVTGFLFTGVFTVLCSMFFVSGPLKYGTADIGYVFSNINVLFMFLVCLLTMRLFSEEQSKKTDRLLFTAPVTTAEVVLGKYISAMLVFIITMAVSSVYPIVMAIFSSPSTGEIFASYLGMLLLWSAFIALGLFMSSLTESQVIAAIITFGALLLLYFWDSLTSLVQNAQLVKLFETVSFFSRYSEFQNGIVNLSSVVYYISFAFLFIFFTITRLERGR